VSWSSPPEVKGVVTDVVVIGAGLAGLTAAATLVEAGAGVSVVEADSDIGGRIRSLRDPVSHRPLADLGPTWVWPKYQPVVARWLAKLGLETFAQFNEGNAVITGYGPAPLYQPLPGQDGMVRIAGGPASLIDELARRVGSANITTHTPVTGIFEAGSEHLAVHLGSGEVITTQRVIVSVPLRVAVATLQLPWLPESLRRAMHGTPTWMATQAKAVALFEGPFWREAGLSGRIASRSGPLVEAHDHAAFDNQPAALFGFIGWTPEQRRRDPAGLRKAILAQLVECFGDTAAQPRALVVQDWATNPWIVTEQDLAHPGVHPDVGPDALRQPQLDGRLRFAVSEVSDQSPGLIEGALAVGERAAQEMLGTRV